MKRRIFGILVTSLLLSGAVQAALVGLSSGRGNPGTIYDIDTSTGAATARATTAETSLVGATFLNGTLYGSDICGADCFSVDSLDLDTGANTFVSDQDGSANWHGLASDEAANLIYSIDMDDNFILKSLTLSGTVTSIGTGTGIRGQGMAYDDANGILYATGIGTQGPGPSMLYTVDTSTGISTLIGSMGVSADQIGLAYDELTDILYANIADIGLYTVNVGSGATTFVGANGFANIDGLAWLNDTEFVPTPGSLALLSLGLAGIGYQRRRQAKAA